MAMNQFEDHLEKSVNNPNRLVNEVLQLENYIFKNPQLALSKEDPEKKRLGRFSFSPMNDLSEFLSYKTDPDNEFEFPKSFRP